MSGLRVAPFCLWSVAVALCVAPLITEGATPEKVKAALDAFESQVTEQNEQTMTARVAEIETVLELSVERAAQLHEVKAKAMEEGVAAWRRRAEKALQAPAITDEQIQQGLVEGPEEADAPERQPAWKDGLKKLLTPADLQRLAERRKVRKERRTRNLADLFLLFADEKLALSIRQRAQLLPIATSLVPKIQEILPEEVEQDDDLFNPGMLLAVSKEAPEKEVRAILSAPQWERWGKMPLAARNQIDMPPIPGLIEPLAAAESASAAKPAAPAVRESVSQTVSRYMATQALLQRQRLLEPLLVQIEEAARVASLSPEVCARLKIGARGSAEKSLAAWAPQYQQFIRNNVPELTPENVTQHLARLGTPTVFPNPTPGAPKPGIFEKCLKAELTAEQMAAWQTEIDARREFRTGTIVRSMLTTFDRVVPLREDQFARLTVMVTALIAEYWEEIETGHGQEQAPWYLQSEIRAAPLAGIKPADMQALLGKPRWERWTKTEEYSDAQSCWNNIKEMRQNRRR